MPATNYRNPLWNDLTQGYQARVNALGQPFLHVASGTVFLAIAVPLANIDPRMDLGADPREMCTLEGLRDQMPVMKLNDIVQQTNPPFNTASFQSFPVWRLTRREDNGANFTIKYWAVKVVAQDTLSPLTS